ncbi:MAG: UPF0182 family protein [Limnochordaceae bacterium]|nr:UPF0182 family protein [Limnochordaceae bacterium]
MLTAAAAWRPWGRYAAGAAIVTLAVAVAGEAGAGLVQRFVVRPNELVREEPFLRHHIAMTRKAYGLDGVREVAFDPKDAIEATDVQAARPLLQEIRLWDWRPLGRAYSQLQEFRPYYDFVEVDVDRYRVGDRIRQVMLSVRELNAQRLQNPSWINRKLQYTHGYGLVMSPASEVSGQGMPRLTVADIPPRSQDGWPQVTRPQIYFGEMAADWIVVQGRTPEFDYPSGDQNVFHRYEGKDGIALTLWNRLLFAARFGSTELLLSPEVSAKSRVLMYRTVMERLQRLMPFLRYDRDPYPIVTRDGHVLWMVDAYTTTDRFPYARPMAGWGNYARNSVKVTLDAYDGTVHFYQVDESEPLASALSDLFGGFLEPASAVPEDVRAHWRYPEDLFWLQAAVYAVYHMVNPGLFYNQEDRWDFPREIHGEQEVVMQPYYAMVDLGDGPEFALLYPFTAQDKQNMTAWMVGRSDPPHYGQLQVFRFPKQRLTYGPMQIEARINQDPDISRELTLWGQRGSRVLRGNLIVVPVRGTVLYVKPLFLVSEQSQLPELRRVVLATSAQLVMAPDLMSALAIATGAQAPAPPATPAALPPAASPTGPQAAQNARLREALDALQQARRRLEAGDWEGFGKAMQRVEALLKEVAGGT